LLHLVGDYLNYTMMDGLTNLKKQLV